LHKENCTIDECEKPMYSVKTGMCRTHHHRVSLGYEPGGRVRGQVYECKHGGCDAGATAKGYCYKHYHQWRRTGRTWGEPSAIKSCTSTDCDRPVVNQKTGLCQSHSSRGSERPLKGDRSSWSECQVSTCQKTMAPGNIVCSVHRMRASQYGLTHGEIIELFVEAKCLACGTTQALAIHHDHSCCSGKYSCGDCVVALLCTPCNKAAGACKDNPDILRLLADALESGSWRSRLPKSHP
jgi:hypothetical protein